MFFESIFLIISGFVIAKVFSGKKENTHGLLNSIYIRLSSTKVFWLHHWITYLLATITFWIVSPYGLYLLLVLGFGVGVIISLSNVKKSFMHWFIFILILSLLVCIHLFTTTEFKFYLSFLFIGIVIQGLVYKDRFEFVKKIKEKKDYSSK